MVTCYKDQKNMYPKVRSEGVPEKGGQISDVGIRGSMRHTDPGRCTQYVR